MESQVEEYELNNLKFILYADKTIIKTPYQTFLLIPARHNYAKRLEELRESIRRGKVGTLTDIVSYCDLKPGRRGQMLGIEMINTRLDRHYVPMGGIIQRKGITIV